MNKVLLVSSLVAISGLAQADTLGLTIGVNAWQQSFDGSVRSGNLGSSIDLENDLDYDGDTGANVYVSFEHPIPLIPNFRIENTELKVEENDTLIRDVDFDGGSYVTATPFEATVDLSHTDLTAYYEVLDNWVSLDVGVTARFFQEGVELSNLRQTGTVEIDYTLPMLYAAVKFELPLSGLYVGGKANASNYDKRDVLDYSVNLGYETDLGLGLELGYRSLSVEESSRQEDYDITVDGAYAGVFFHF
ncbi:MAG: TIGR04219 family outer membrane beta-barrel protein [Sinobacterium sp.]|jgi:outer membrane protein